jgi:DNA-binding transcriptional regulator YdaS (Cro superfamily)
MKLEDYLSEVETAASLARKLGRSPVLVSQWRNKIREVPIERCLEIESATESRVTRRELRPTDWWRVWPELVTEDFPAPESSQEAA